MLITYAAVCKIYHSNDFELPINFALYHVPHLENDLSWQTIYIKCYMSHRKLRHQPSSFKRKGSLTVIVMYQYTNKMCIMLINSNTCCSSSDRFTGSPYYWLLVRIRIRSLFKNFIVKYMNPYSKCEIQCSGRGVGKCGKTQRHSTILNH